MKLKAITFFSCQLIFFIICPIFLYAQHELAKHDSIKQEVTKYHSTENDSIKEEVVEHHSAPNDYEQGGGNVPFFKKLIFFLDKNQRTNKRLLKQYEETGNILFLEEYLKTPEARQRQHAENPLVYYMIQAIVAESKGGDSKRKELVYYSVAIKIDDEGMRTLKDLDILKDIESLDDKFKKLGINNFDNYYKWLESKYDEHRKYYEISSERLEEVIDSLKQRIMVIEDSIAIEKDNIDLLEIEINELENDKIKEAQNRSKYEQNIADIKLKPHYQKVAVRIENIETLRQNDYQKLKERFNNGNTQIARSKLSIDNKNITLVFKQKDSDDGIKISATGQASGKHCTADIQNATQQIMNVLLAEIRENKNIVRDQLSINLNIIGHADWSGAGKSIGIIYTAENDIDEAYVNQDGIEQSFRMQSGQTKSILNEHLAFLRAYCAYQTIQNILRQEKLQLNKISFEAQEHFERPSSENKDGADFRGIELSVTINNLYEQYERQIKTEETKIEKTIRKIEQYEQKIQYYNGEIENKERWIIDKNKDIIKIWEEIDKKEAQKSEIEYAIGSADPYKYANSEASETIAKVKEDKDYWLSLTKKEKKNIQKGK